MKVKIESESFIKKKEVSEIDFIKELFLSIVVSVTIVFLTFVVFIGTFFENNFCREILVWFGAKENSIESNIQNSGFALLVVLVILLLVISNLGSKTKSEVLKKILNSKLSKQLYILIAVVLLAVVFWKVASLVIIGFIVVFALLMIGVFINNRV
jgi:polyferredoxin